MPIEPDFEQRQALGEAVLAFVNQFVEGRQTSPASWGATDAQLTAALSAPPPERGVDIEPLLGLVQEATETGFDTAGPGFLSYIPTGGLYTSALGSLIGAAVNRYTGGSHASPGVTAIEQSVIDWMVSLFGLPDTAGGLLLSGGSIANLTAVVTARTRLGDRFDDGVVYTSDRAHHSVAKAARIAGIAPERVHVVATDAHLRLDPAALTSAIAEDARAGLRPMMVAATAGTTDTGAIDPLRALADVAASANVWFHVDAAYGGFFQLTDRGRRRLVGIERADSITVDAHKSLLLPFGIGGLVMRDPRAFTEAHEGHGAYLRDVVDGEIPHYFALGPELSRPSRGLAVWLALHLHGVGEFRDTLDRMLDLAELTAERLARVPGLVFACEPELSVVAVRSAAGDDATERLLAALNQSRQVHVSSTTIDDRLYLRLAFLSQRTDEKVALRAIELIADVMAT